MALREDLAALTWLEPWAPLQPTEARERERELASSLSDLHPLYGRKAEAIAARTDDASDVLFCVSTPDQLAVVNLVPGRKTKGSAQIPFFVPYDSVDDFEQGCMAPDHLEYSDEDT